MSDYVQVSTATDSREAGIRLAQSAVAGRLAASAQVVGPVASVFWHLDQQGNGEEWQVLLITTASRYAELEQHLIAEHTWTNPQVTATAIVDGSNDYLAWLRRTVEVE
ncbi:divalent cation tolerance protein CutA [Micromonospora sp. WMMD1082]|nr:divalent cation tolerance protein CutA [Micromonospora sp. WMMD1082]MDG4793253.1 divalent cation tolerance protein CutA [Micromonospora sp. WMMD1082]